MKKLMKRIKKYVKKKVEQAKATYKAILDLMERMSKVMKPNDGKKE
jgi:hypothetical protein